MILKSSNLKCLDIYLDMDGVCVDWVKGVLKILKREDLINNIPENCKSIEEATSLNLAYVRNEISKHGSEWWRNLEELPWFWELYNTLIKLGRVTFLTSPSPDPNCSKGKIEWLYDRFGNNFKDYIITPQKYHCSHKNSILIDDTLEKCQEFLEKDGQAVLFPTEFNGLIWQFIENKKINKTDILTYTIERVNDALR
jgi:5'(3')-deoxyribonucleotidase